MITDRRWKSNHWIINFCFRCTIFEFNKSPIGACTKNDRGSSSPSSAWANAGHNNNTIPRRIVRDSVHSDGNRCVEPDALFLLGRFGKTNPISPVFCPRFRILLNKNGNVALSVVAQRKKKYAHGVPPPRGPLDDRSERGYVLRFFRPRRHGSHNNIHRYIYIHVKLVLDLKSIVPSARERRLFGIESILKAAELVSRSFESKNKTYKCHLILSRITGGNR